MTGEKQTAYDEIPYPSLAHAETHPSRLATAASLFGMHPAPVERCRVLELGCGDGMNIIAMACGLPGSEFVGVESAASHVAEGRQMIADLGLKNIRLDQLDLMEFRLAGEPFDYIIAHGVYSWTPAVVRDRVLAICHECLAPHGIAYVSYNAYPGCHLREMSRRMMLLHTRGFSDPRQKIDQSRSLLRFLATAKTETDIYQLILQTECEHAAECGDGAFNHDDLNPWNQPFYLHEVVEHASKHHLQYLGDADFKQMEPEDFAADGLEAPPPLENDRVAREQYFDFLVGRSFRSTLLCRSEVPLSDNIQPGAITQMSVSFVSESLSQKADVNASPLTNHPLGKAMLTILGRRWPRSLQFQELLAAARDLLPAEVALDADSKENIPALCGFLLRAYTTGLVELHTWTPPFVTVVSERPIASPVARYQSLRGKRMSTLWHTIFELDDDLARRLFELLDGTHDSAALVEALAARLEGGPDRITHDGKPVTDPVEIRAMLAAGLPAILKRFAAAAVLVG